MHGLELNKRGLVSFIGHFGRYQNTLCVSPQILHKHALFLFSLGTIVSLKRNLKQNLGGPAKSIMVFSEATFV